ncbi:hypothetical protein OXH55_17650 [Clostridium ganghwense]|uniref:Uncharacterized protein n=1 Tax=Clostridium ganghwense TaxID=312089 RepID=A0ABT4CTQ4_9CLOT|nr:hypothetical protein [Clostridium ganghwense]
MTREEALSFIKNAKLSISKWNGKFENYYSFDGATYVDIENKNIRTAFKQEEFKEDVEKMIEVLKNMNDINCPNHSND